MATKSCTPCQASRSFRQADSIRRRVTRRPPPPATGSLGVGSLTCYPSESYSHFYAGDRNPRHVAAIEVAVFHPTIGEIPYTLVAMTAPLQEVLDTFLEDSSLHMNGTKDYALAYNGRILGRDDTPSSIGLDPYTEWPAAVLEVVEIGPGRIMAALREMNRLGAALRIDRGGFNVQRSGVHLSNVDALSHVFAFLDLGDLVAVTVTCVLWHNVSQRLSLLLQLQCSAPPDVEEYPVYLNLLAEFSATLDLAAECRSRTEERRRWAAVGASKQSGGAAEPYGHRVPRRWNRPNMFAKAANCTIMRTVQAGLGADEVRRLTLPLRADHMRFMVPPRYEDGPDMKKKRTTRTNIEEEVYASADDGDDGALNLQTPSLKRNAWPSGRDLKTNRNSYFRMRRAAAAEPASEGSWSPEVIKEADASLQRMSVNLFREYFSPSMHFIFPLIAHQQSLHGLDFRSTQTWGVRGGFEESHTEPVGAVAWRIRKPLLSISNERSGDATPSSKLASHDVLLVGPTMEVLFIAVWEDDRGARYGGAMVEALEAEARDTGCRYMYVEVGHEQPLARRFWGGIGFEPTARAGVSDEQSLFFENACLRFSDTEQFVKRVL